MTPYKQNDTRWADLTYDGVNKFKSYGCFVTCLAMLCDKLPTDTAKTLKDNGLFTNGYLNNSSKAASVLGLEYKGTSATKPDYDCIAQTNYYDKPSTSAIEQHFIIVKADGSQIDPLGLKTNYPIVNYRLFKGGDMIPANLVQGRLYNSDGKVLYWIPDPDTATKYFGDWSQQKPISEIVAPQIKEVIKEVEKVVEVKVPVEITKTIIQEVFKEKELSNDEKLYIRIGKAIKEFLVRVSSWIKN